MRLDGFGLFVDDMPTMVRFYRDVLGFEIKEDENAINVYLIKDGTLFMLYERKNFENMTSRKYEYLKGLNGLLRLRCMWIPSRKWMHSMQTQSLRVPGLCWSLPRSLGGSAPAISQTQREI